MENGGLHILNSILDGGHHFAPIFFTMCHVKGGVSLALDADDVEQVSAGLQGRLHGDAVAFARSLGWVTSIGIGMGIANLRNFALIGDDEVQPRYAAKVASLRATLLSCGAGAGARAVAGELLESMDMDECSAALVRWRGGGGVGGMFPDKRYTAVSMFLGARGDLDVGEFVQCVTGSFEEWFGTIEGCAARVSYVLSLGEMCPGESTVAMYHGEDGHLPTTKELLGRGELPYPFLCRMDPLMAACRNAAWTKRYPDAGFRGSSCRCISEYDAWSRFFEREFSTGGVGVGSPMRRVRITRGGVMPLEQEFSSVGPISRYTGETRDSMMFDCMRAASSGRDKEPGGGRVASVNIQVLGPDGRMMRHMVDFELGHALLVRLTALDPDDLIVMDIGGEAETLAIRSTRVTLGPRGPMGRVPNMCHVIDSGSDLSVTKPHLVSRWRKVYLGPLAAGVADGSKVTFTYGKRDLRGASLESDGETVVSSAAAAAAAASSGSAGRVEWTQDLATESPEEVRNLIDSGRITLHGEVVKWQMRRVLGEYHRKVVRRCSGCGRLPVNGTETHSSGLAQVMMRCDFLREDDDADYVIPVGVPDGHIVKGSPVKSDVDTTIMHSQMQGRGLACSAEGYASFGVGSEGFWELIRTVLRPVEMTTEFLIGDDAASLIKEASRCYSYVSRVAGAAWRRDLEITGCVASRDDTVRFAELWKHKHAQCSQTAGTDKVLFTFLIMYTAFFGSPPPMHILCALASQSKGESAGLEGHVRLDDIWAIMGEMSRISGMGMLDEPKMNHARRIYGNGSLDPLPERKRVNISRRMVAIAIRAIPQQVTVGKFGVSVGGESIYAEDIVSWEFIANNLVEAHTLAVESMNYVHNARVAEIAERSLSRGFIRTLIARQNAYLEDAARGAQVLLPVYLEGAKRLETPSEVLCRVDDSYSMRMRSGGRGYMAMIDQFVQIGRRVWFEVGWLFDCIPVPGGAPARARLDDLRLKFRDAAMHVLFSPSGGVLPFSSTSVTLSGYVGLLASQFPHLCSSIPRGTSAPEWQAKIVEMAEATKVFASANEDKHGPVYAYADVGHRWVKALACVSGSVRFMAMTDRDIVRNIGMNGFAAVKSTGKHIVHPVAGFSGISVHAPEVLGSSSPGMRALSVVELLARDACVRVDEIPREYESMTERTESTIMSGMEKGRFLALRHDFVVFFLMNIDGLIREAAVGEDPGTTNGCELFGSTRAVVLPERGDLAMGFAADSSTQISMESMRDFSNTVFGGTEAGFPVPAVKDTRFEMLSHGTLLSSSCHEGVTAKKSSCEDGTNGTGRFFGSIGGTRTKMVLAPIHTRSTKGVSVDRDVAVVKTAWGMGLSTGRAFRHPVIRSCVMVSTYEGFVPFPLLVDERYYREVLTKVLLYFDPKDREFYVRRGSSLKQLLRNDVPRFFKMSRGGFTWEHGGGTFDFRADSYIKNMNNRGTRTRARVDKRMLEEGDGDSGKRSRPKSKSVNRKQAVPSRAVVPPKGICVACGNTEGV